MQEGDQSGSFDRNFCNNKCYLVTATPVGIHFPFHSVLPHNWSIKKCCSRYNNIYVILELLLAKKPLTYENISITYYILRICNYIFFFHYDLREDYDPK